MLMKDQEKKLTGIGDKLEGLNRSGQPAAEKETPEETSPTLPRTTDLRLSNKEA